MTNDPDGGSTVVTGWLCAVVILLTLNVMKVISVFESKLLLSPNIAVRYVFIALDFHMRK